MGLMAREGLYICFYAKTSGWLDVYRLVLHQVVIVLVAVVVLESEVVVAVHVIEVALPTGEMLDRHNSVLRNQLKIARLVRLVYLTFST